MCVMLAALLPAEAFAAQSSEDDKTIISDNVSADSPSRLEVIFERFDRYLEMYESYETVNVAPPTFNTVSILDTDFLDTDDVVAVQRFASCANAYGVASCVNGGDAAIRGLLDSIGSTLPVASSTSATGNAPFWDIYKSVPSSAQTTVDENGLEVEEVFEEGYEAGSEESSGSYSALWMYKDALRYNKVDIITIGYLNNLYDLLNDPEGYQLALANLNAVYITGGSLKGLGDCNFNTSPELLNMSIFVTNTLREMGIYTVYLTGDLGGCMNTAPFDGRCAQAFATMLRDTTPSWDIFSVWVYKMREYNPYIRYVRTALYIKPDSSNEFKDKARTNSFRVVKVALDKELERLI